MHTDVWRSESARGWIVVAGTFVNLAMVYGIWYSYSVFLVAMLREFGWSRSTVAGAFSVFVMVHGLFSPFNGWLVGRVGPRRVILAGGFLSGLGVILAAETTNWWHLYLAFGGVAAIGVACAGWVPSIVLVRKWFPDRVGTALGVSSAGIGIGIGVLVPLMQMLVDLVGWRWAYRALGVATTGWVIPATLLLLRDPPSDGDWGVKSGRLPGGEVYWTLASAVRDWHFWGLAIVFGSGNVATQMLLVHQVAFLVDHGVAALVAATIAGLAGLVSILGKVSWGVLSDRTNRELAYSIAFTCVIASIGTLVLAGLHPGSALPYLYAVFIGLGYAATAPLTPAAASDLFGGPKFSTIFGTLHLSNAIGASAGAWAAGCIFDVTGNYAMALVLALAAALISAGLMWVVAPRRPHPPPEGLRRKT